MSSFKYGNTIKPAFDNVEDMAKSLELSSRRQSVITNSLDWQCAAAANLTKEMLDSKKSQTTENLKIVNRILLSAGKSITQLENEQTVALANLRLRRRDAYLKSLGPIPEEEKSKLRTTGIRDTRLFEEETLKHTLSRVRDEANIKSTFKTVQLVEKLSAPKKQEPKKSGHFSDYKKPNPQKKGGAPASATATSSSSYRSNSTYRNSSKAPPRAGRGGGRS